MRGAVAGGTLCGMANPFLGLSNAASYKVSGDQLTITLKDAGTLEFTKAAS